MKQHVSTHDEIFAYSASQKERSMNYSFRVNKPLKNREAMHQFLTTRNLLEHTDSHLSGMVFLQHPNYEFQAIVESHNEDYLHMHGITVYRYDSN